VKFEAWARKGADPEGLRSLEVKAGMSTQSDPDGGFMVPEEMDKSLDKLAIDSVAMRRIARVTSASGDYKRLLSSGGATGGWVGEEETRDETDTPDLKQFNPPWSELYMLPAVTQVLLDDSAFDLAAWLLDELQDVETSMEGAAFISGNGVKKPKGFLNYDTVANASWEWGKIGYVASGHASLVNNADKLIDLQHALKPLYRRNGTWLMNDTTFATFRKFKDGDGNYLWRPGLIADAPDIFLGKPVEIDDNMPDIGSDVYPVAFGDWKRAYLIGDHKVGRRLLRDPYTTKGKVKFYLTKRVFGGVINHQAIKLMKVSV
jgi:HK97 family phage major capsid protein